VKRRVAWFYVGLFKVIKVTLLEAIARKVGKVDFCPRYHFSRCSKTS